MSHEISKTSSPHFNGRFKARSPEPLGRSRRWNDRSTGDVLDGWSVDSIATGSDSGRPDISIDDEADFDSGYGSLDM